MGREIAHAFIVASAFGWALGLRAAAAHEFWIEPKAFSFQAGEPVVADLKVGQKLVGAVYPYIRAKFVAYTVTTGGRRQDVKAADGDTSVSIRPAQGLAIIAYHSVPEETKFKSWADVLDYLQDEGNTWVADAHRRRGLPEGEFSETYSRCAKVLVEVGKSSREERDQPVGMPLELVAGENPYALAAPKDMTVALLWQGKPFAGAQITVFQYDGKLTETKLRTDVDGRAVIPSKGGGAFLLNAVHMQKAAPEHRTQWESHWASLVFFLPLQR